MKKRYIIAAVLTGLLLHFSHHIWLGHSKNYSFNIFIFLIILILGYLLFLKLTSYLADFKTIKNKSRIEIVFLTIFFILLFLPMSHINQSEISEEENRTLAVWQPLITQEDKINENFGKDFNDWFNDRFNFRKQLLYFDFGISDNNNPEAFKGKSGWLFYKGDNSISNYQNSELYTKEELEKIAKYLTSIDKYCKSKNKKFYFFIAPDKHRIYGEFYPNYIKKFAPNSKSSTMQLISYLKENTDIKIIYPYKELIKNKDKGLLYYKNDTHWNLLGAYIGYSVLVKEFEKDNLPIKPVKISSFETQFNEIGDLTRMFMQIKKDKTEYKIPIVKEDFIKHKTISQNNIPEHVYTQKNINTPQLLIYRDSFTISLIPFLSNTFKRIDYRWTWDANKKEIAKSDIVLLEIVERYLPHLSAKELKE